MIFASVQTNGLAHMFYSEFLGEWLFSWAFTNCKGEIIHNSVNFPTLYPVWIERFNTACEAIKENS